MGNVQAWVTLIGAVAAAIVSIITAFRGQRMERTVNAMAAAAPQPVPGVRASDVFRFWGLLQALAGAWSNFKGLGVGQTAPVPEIKTIVDGHSYRFFGAQVEKLD